MVQEQGEQISRIDDNVEAVTENVEGVSSRPCLARLSRTKS
jgi:t-SNARE complex subunit (syntaxin)